MYHLELRQFPKRVQRYNLSGTEVGAIVIPWVQDRAVELGEQRWSPHTATLTIFEGPEIELGNVSLGRGWRAVERRCEDVTDRVVAEARTAIASGPSRGGAGDAADADAAGDPLALGVELGALLGDQPARLLAAWRSVVAESAGLSPSEALSRAERNLGRDG